MSTLAHLPVLREPSLAAAIREGLLDSPRRLPPACFYDEVGSALFDAITVLPEYGLTRADFRLLRSQAGRIAAALPRPLDVIELGSGGGGKARLVLEALSGTRTLRYRPVDVSAAALADCQERLASLPALEVLPLEATYLDGLEEAATRRRFGATVLVLFLGSNLGNFHRPEAREFLREVRGRLRPGDALLASVDLEKEEDRLLAAYDDASGVTAAFNRNALAHLNRELDADFDVAAYRHRAVYDTVLRRVEMHLVPTTDETVRVKALGLEVRIDAGDGIWTESSYKFRTGELASMGEAAGFQCALEATDREWPFSLNLLVAQ